MKRFTLVLVGTGLFTQACVLAPKIPTQGIGGDADATMALAQINDALSEHAINSGHGDPSVALRCQTGSGHMTRSGAWSAPVFDFSLNGCVTGDVKLTGTLWPLPDPSIAAPAHH